jgi:hypothetical protein
MDWMRWNWMTEIPHLLWLRKCPRCASIKFKPAEQRGYDGLISMFLLHPVRCAFCWRRFYRFSFPATDQG